MIGAMQQLVRSTDSAVARVYLSLFRERSALVCFLFHSLFRNQREIEQNLMDPLDRTTVTHLRELVEYYLEHGYRFISPRDLLAGAPADEKLAMLTFDDGYYNNTLALPVLEAYHIPAVFFISTNHVRDGRSFWWDVIYRERVAHGASPRQVYREALEMKSLRTEEIERRLIERFGASALQPRSDLDRPFTVDELREFARHPLVHLGNHTANHAILTNYTLDEARAQIVDAQRALVEMTGTSPCSIAYPNGAYDEQIEQICRDNGLPIGFTIQPRKNPLPLAGSSIRLSALGRFVPHSESTIRSQCRTYRSDWLVYGALRAQYVRLLRSGASN